MNSKKVKIILAVGLIASLTSFVGLLILPQSKVSTGGSVRLFEEAMGYTTPYGSSDWHIVDSKRRWDGGWMGTASPFRTTIHLSSNTNVWIEASGKMFESVDNKTGSLGIFIDGNLVHKMDFGSASFQPLTVPFLRTETTQALPAGSHTIELKIRSTIERGQALISKPSLWIKY